MKLRPRLLALAAACVVASLAVAVLAANESGKRQSTAADRPSCQFESTVGKVETEPSSDTVICSESRDIYVAFKEAELPGTPAGFSRTSRVEDWNCREYPFLRYPLLVRCHQGRRRFDVVGLASIILSSKGSPPTRSSKPVLFQTPTGDIACRISRRQVRCDIFARSWRPPPGSRDCSEPWGSSIELRRKGVVFICTGRTVILPDGESGIPVLKRGNATGVGSFTCSMRKQGLSCAGPGEHSVLLSFQRVKLA